MENQQIKIISQWFELCHDAGVSLVSATEIAQKVVDAYSENHRHYHTLDHVNHCLTVLDTIPNVIEERQDIQFAIWFHDLIYDPESGLNEYDSALFAYNWLTKQNIANPANVRDLIQITGDYLHPPEGNFSVQIMHDVDLSILASPDETYRQYALGIRAEYSHLNDSEFYSARQKFLHGLLERTPLFLLEALEHQWEGQARTNMKAEIGRIEKYKNLSASTKK